jgi:hypothetical protein
MNEDIEIEEQIEIKAGCNILEVLGNTCLSLDENISEFIDNSIQSAKNAKHSHVNIEIEIGVSQLDSSKNYFKIKDDSCGMSQYILEKALAPGETSAQQGGLHEHGIGLNHSISGIGTLDYIKTKRINDKQAIVCSNYKMGVVPISRKDWDVLSGTEIVLNKIKKPIKRKEDYRGIINKLKSRYRYFLCDAKESIMDDQYRPFSANYNEKFAHISFKVYNIDTNINIINENLESSFPRYCHPVTKENKPYVEKNFFEGDKGNWNAILSIGFAPSKKIDKKNNSKDLYGVAQGIDIVVSGRIIKSGALKEIGIDLQKEGNSWMRVRGELHLEKGFKTTSAKNNILEDENFYELKDKIKSYLQSIGFWKLAPRKAQDEEKICDRLYDLFSELPLYKKVEKGYRIGDPVYPKDLVTTCDNDKKYVWEVKCETAGQKEVLQPFGYIINDSSLERIGFLVAKTFTKAAYDTQAAILKETGIKIEFKSRDKFIPVDEE